MITRGGEGEGKRFAGDRKEVKGVQGKIQGLQKGKSISFQHFLIFSFVVLSIKYQELAYARV